MGQTGMEGIGDMEGMLLYGCPWWDAGGLCHHADCSQVLCISCVAEAESLVSSSIQLGG